MSEQLSQTQQLRLNQERIKACIKEGWGEEDIKKLFGWNATQYKSLFRTVYEEIKEYVGELPPDDTSIDEAIMRTFNYATDQKKVKTWTDPRTGKVWADVTDFFT